MPYTTNEFGQPIGLALADWHAPTVPQHHAFNGYGCRLEPLNAAQHAAALWLAFSADQQGRMWTYLPWGPFADQTADQGAFNTWLSGLAGQTDLQMYAVLDAANDNVLGIAGYLRITPAAGSIEVGCLAYSPALQRNRLATAAMMLMMENAFALGYRRYEWKCDALNAPSCRAAERLGFLYEGTFRQAIVTKNRNRDTAWYSIIDSEWPALQAALSAWLAPENFDADGLQRSALSDMTRAALASVRGN